MDALILAKWLIELEASLPCAILIHGELGSRNQLTVLVDPELIGAGRVFAVDVDLKQSGATIGSNDDLSLGLRCIVTGRERIGRPRAKIGQLGLKLGQLGVLTGELIL